MRCSFLITGVWKINYRSMEGFRRRYGIEKGLLPEHPRTGPTDDGEK
jgi:hypothetical protein